MSLADRTPEELVATYGVSLGLATYAVVSAQQARQEHLARLRRLDRDERSESARRAPEGDLSAALAPTT